jgi:hypothetical protein
VRLVSLFHSENAHYYRCVLMRVHPVQALPALVFALISLSFAQANPMPENPTKVVIKAFETHDIVMLGEIHWNKQEYEWLRFVDRQPLSLPNRNWNIKLEIKTKHLAAPERLTPAKNSYVVWIRSTDGQTQNAGLIDEPRKCDHYAANQDRFPSPLARAKLNQTGCESLHPAY